MSRYMLLSNRRPRIQDGAVLENMALQTKIEQLVNIGVYGRPAGVAAGNQENM